MNDSLLHPKKPKNAYVKATGLPLAYRDTTNELVKIHLSSSDPRVLPDSVFDPNSGLMVQNPCLVYGNSCYSPLNVSVTRNGIPDEQLGYYTVRGFKTMARFSINFGTLFGMDKSMGADAFKLYGEWALLGVKDQPFYYDKKSERMPVMFGLNIPTFGILDMLSVEMEYLKSRFRNNLTVVFQKKWSLPLTFEDEDPTIYNLDDPRFNPPAGYDDADYPALDKAARKKEMEEDDWKWSIYVRKQIIEGLTIYGQAARDHLRQITWEGGPKFAGHSSTQFSGEWYYIVRMELGI